MKQVLCFGEVLWDCLSENEHAGGAPLNVAYHLRKLQCKVGMLSAVGNDDRGERMLRRLKEIGVDARHVSTHADLPTGIATASLDDEGNAVYEIAQPAAWDRITIDPGLTHEMTETHALVYGSLACRSPENLEALKYLVALYEPLKVFDVNLRAPFDDVEHVLELGRRSDVIKLNEEELYRLTSLPHDEEEPNLHEAVHRFSAMTGCETICVTRGRAGALLLREGDWFSAGAPAVEVRNTVGAGDAFTAGFIRLLLSDRVPTDFAAGLSNCCILGSLVASREEAQPEYDPAELFGDRFFQ